MALIPVNTETLVAQGVTAGQQVCNKSSYVLQIYLTNTQAQPNYTLAQGQNSDPFIVDATIYLKIQNYTGNPATAEVDLVTAIFGGSGSGGGGITGITFNNEFGTNFTAVASVDGVAPVAPTYDVPLVSSDIPNE